jgi:hypothetical protein
MPEAKEKVAEERKAPERKSYTVADGAEITAINNGEVVTRKGGESIDLTNEQAEAFADKLDMKEEDERPTPASVIVGEEIGNRSTIVEAAADAAAAEGLGKEDRAKAEESDETNTAGGAAVSAGGQQAGAGAAPAQQAAATAQATKPVAEAPAPAKPK